MSKNEEKLKTNSMDEISDEDLMSVTAGRNIKENLKLPKPLGKKGTEDEEKQAFDPAIMLELGGPTVKL